jgi:hypothetical protein
MLHTNKSRQIVKMCDVQDAESNIYLLPLSVAAPVLIVALQDSLPAIRKLYVYIKICGIRNKYFSAKLKCTRNSVS